MAVKDYMRTDPEFLMGLKEIIRQEFGKQLLRELLIFVRPIRLEGTYSTIPVIDETDLRNVFYQHNITLED